MSSWSWLRIYYFTPCKDALLLDGLLPAFRQIQHDATQDPKLFFERDWIGGPNILVGLAPGSTSSDISIFTDACSEYVKRVPSTSSFSKDDYRRRAITVGELEARRAIDLDLPLQENNTILRNCGEPFSPILPEGPLREEMRAFLCESTPIVLRCLEMIRTGEICRSTLVIQSLASVAWAADPESLRAHISFRSHCSGFLRYLGSKELIERFRQQYDAERADHIKALVRSTVSQLQAGTATPHLLEFASLIRRTLLRTYDMFQSGELGALPVKQFRAVDHGDPHAAASLRLNQLLKDDLILRAWRFSINLAYLAMNQLGVSALERYLACYLVGRACEEIFGLSSNSIANSLATTGDAAAVITTLKARASATA